MAGRTGWEEVVHGELHLAEDFARIIFRAAGTDALLRGQAVVVYRDQQLGVALQADDRELAQSDIDALSVIAEAEVRAKAGADAGRDIKAVAVTGGTALAAGRRTGRAAGSAGGARCTGGAARDAALAGIHQLHAQHHGVHHFCNCNGQVAVSHAVLIALVKAALRAEDFCTAFAAVENHSLVKDRKAADFNRTGRANKGLCGDPIEIAEINAVEATVEPRWLYVDLDVKQFSFARADAQGAVNHVL